MTTESDSRQPPEDTVQEQAAGSACLTAAEAESDRVAPPAENGRQRIEQRLTGLLAIARAILEAHSAEEIAGNALEHLNSLLGCQFGTVIVIDHTIHSAQVIAVRSAWPTRFQAGQSFTSGPHSLEDLVGEGYRLRNHLDPTQGIVPMDMLLYAEGVRAALFVPLVARGQILGLLGLAAGIPDFFTDEQIALAREVADQMAVAIQQVQLFAAIQRHATSLEQRVAERTSELQQLGEIYSTVFNHAARGIIVLNGDGLIRGLNPAAEQMLGYSAHELVDQATLLIFHTDADLLEQGEIEGQVAGRVLLERLLRLAQQADQSEWTLVRKDGSRFAASLSLSMLQTPDGTVSGYVALIADITERRQAEARLHRLNSALTMANTELERAARLKDEFLASMSHELRTPLNSVLGRAEALLDGAYEQLGERQAQAVQAIEKSGRHLLELISDILDFSKIQAGKLELERSTVAIWPLSIACLQMVSQMAQKKKLQISSTIDATAETIYADERRLRQILVNLLTNAIKFTPQGGLLGLEVSANEPQHRLSFTVWDSGIGIAAEDIERLFQPFVQLDAGLSRQHPGTGLGLALVASLVRMHGGSVAVESMPGQGSRFTVNLPWHGNRVVEPH